MQRIQHSYDELDETLEVCAERLGLARAESMEMINDPRFFSKNVMDKRLEAFQSLLLVSGLMVGTAIKCCFSLKKDMDFSKYDPFLFFGIPIVGCIGWWQFAGFLLQMTVVFMCTVAVYVISHQLFYAYRLLTSGPLGFEQASVFYLNKTVCMWRHIAIKCLLNGLWLFLVSAGMTLFVKFYKDAASTQQKFQSVVVMNPKSQNITAMEEPKEGVSLFVHSIIAYIDMACFFAMAFLLWVVRAQHLGAFRECYTKARASSAPLLEATRNMQHRSHRKLLEQGADKFFLDT
mmetsp:Transcript_107904/g.304005  ORF Transcript_107904/g.304005 Transcript_107904/m.304005 type:complete len:290 (+) Transcript_107904:117-986(+)